MFSSVRMALALLISLNCRETEREMERERESDRQMKRQMGEWKERAKRETETHRE